MFTKIKSYFWMAMAIVLGALLATQTLRLHNAELAEARTGEASAVAREGAAVGLALGESKNRTIEFNLAETSAGITKATNVSVQNSTAQRDDLLKRVRNAESNLATAHLVSKTTTASSTAGATTGGDEPELLGSYGEQDVEEAYRAETIRLHLEGCYKNYRAARAALSQ